MSVIVCPQCATRLRDPGFAGGGRLMCPSCHSPLWVDADGTVTAEMPDLSQPLRDHANWPGADEPEPNRTAQMGVIAGGSVAVVVAVVIAVIVVNRPKPQATQARGTLPHSNAGFVRRDDPPAPVIREEESRPSPQPA